MSKILDVEKETKIIISQCNKNSIFVSVALILKHPLNYGNERPPYLEPHFQI